MTDIDSTFAEGFMEDHPEIHVIAFNSDSILGVDKNAGKKMHYVYQPDPDTVFHWHLLAEVGKLHLWWFTETLAMLKYNVENHETDTDYYEVLVDLIPGRNGKDI